jgi:hypothetical protein
LNKFLWRSRVAGKPTIYLIDTDVLVRIRARKDSKEIYAAVVAMAEKGELKTVRQVFDELKSHGKAFDALRSHKLKFVIPTKEQYCAEVKRLIEEIGNKAGFLWEQTGGKNPDPADPWLIAVAVHYGYTVVTNESAAKNTRIPAACKIDGIKCRCISGPHFLFEAKIVTEIKPEQISVAAFFDEGS